MGGERQPEDRFLVEWEIPAVEPEGGRAQLELDLRDAGVAAEVVIDLTEAQAEAEALADRIRNEATGTTR